MRGSFSVSVVLALSSLFVISNEASAQTVPPNIRKIINDMNLVNPSIALEIRVPLQRCKNQFARKKWIEDYARSIAPNIARLVSDKASAEATLVLAARDLTTAQSAVGAAVAAIAAIDVQLRDRNLAGEQQIAAIDSQIEQAVAEKAVASDLAEEENRSWGQWKDTGSNDDDLDAATNRLYTNQTLTTRDREVLQKLNEHRAKEDTLSARVIQAEHSVATFLQAKQNAQNGISQSVQQLQQQKTQKETEKRSADVRLAAVTRSRDLKETEVRSLTARIAGLTAVKAPPIHWACSKLLAK
jgi:hypothetical protein